MFDTDDDRPRWAAVTSSALEELLDPTEYTAARRSILNAHYTSPEIAAGLWQVLTETGWNGQRVWEPGCGIGVFAATAPDNVLVTGVELDPVTARLAARLHEPAGHTIINTGLEDAPVNGSFDAAVGNVPFADVRPFHPEANPDRELVLHNLAIRQALRAVTPGSPVAVITSSFTLDASTPDQRQLLAAEGRFLGALRLPQTAFEAQSGTSVTTDIVIFQRLADGEPADLDGWRNITTVEVANGGAVSVNEWFANHPDLIVGELTDGGMYSRTSSRVVLPAEDFPAALRSGLAQLTEMVETRKAPYPAVADPTHQPTARPARVAATERPDWVKPGGIYRHQGDFWQHPVGAGPDVRFEPKPKADRARIGHLVSLRDTYMQLVEAEASDAPTAELDKLRADLNRHYDAATVAGPLNQVNTSTRKDGVEVNRRPPFGGMRANDPDFATMMGLEDFNAETGAATKAPIFTQRQLRRPLPTVSVDSPEEAVTVAMHQRGRLDRTELAALLNIGVDAVDQAVAGAAFTEPGTNHLIPRNLYLSGDVRSKLDTATAAAKTDGRFEPNVVALTKALPPTLDWDEISVHLGATWIRPSEVKAFLDETFDGPTTAITVNYNPAVGWDIDISSTKHSRAEAFIETWGTERVPAPVLVEKGLRNEAIKVYDTVSDGDRDRSVLNHEETVKANQKLDEINLAFNDWLGADPARSQTLTDRYNRLFRSHVAPTFDGNLPRPAGLAEGISLRPHQAAAVQRALLTGSEGLYHAVGAGKTYVMATTAMELRRLGLANRPMLVVPNHLLSQFAGEFQRAYPQAQILVPDGRTPEARRRFIGQCAAGDWDCVIVPQSMFLAIPVAAETEAEYIATRTDDLREAIDAAKAGGHSQSRSVKQAEKRVARLEAKLEELLDRPRDPTLCFDHTGVDALMVDEAHDYKNLEVVTSRADLAVSPSQRASDLDMKLQLLRATNERPTLLLATATPISNSFHELWVMMRYTSPTLLAAAGVDRFDAFCAQFGDVVTDFELSPTGWRLKDRFAAFRNVPELQNLFAQTADVRLPQDLDIPRPALEGGKPQHVTVPSNPALVAYIATLEHRSLNLPQDPREDNRLKILTDYRKAAIDLRLVGQPQPTPSKLTVTADQIASRYHTQKDWQYNDPNTSKPSPITGSLQIVFLDAGVPGGAGHDLYNVLRNDLADRGVPADKVAFIHDVKDPKSLFAAARQGRVSVLVGSTLKMGTGMNVQTRVTALTHIDVPWRPADIEQRNGRGQRQGNQNDTMRIEHLIQEGSGDALSYQGLERKATMINAVLTNTNTARTVTAPDQSEITFGDLKALASGDPKAIELLRAKRTLGELEIAHRSWQRQVTRARTNLPAHAAAIGDAEARARTLGDAAAAIGDTPNLTATRPLRPDETVNQAIIDQLPLMGSVRATPVAVIDGQQITARIVPSPKGEAYQFSFDSETSGTFLTVARNEITPTTRLTVRITNAIAEIDELADQAQQQIVTANSNLNQASTNAAKKFTKSAELDAARLKVTELHDALAKPPETSTDTAKPGQQKPDPVKITAATNNTQPKRRPPAPKPTSPTVPRP